MMNVAEIRITEAVWPEDRAPIARLMREYVEALEVDISFQDFESEYASLPGKYARPEGVVLIGWTADEAVGIVAYRPFENRICVVRRALQSPVRQVVENAGEDGSIVVGKLLDATAASTRQPAIMSTWSKPASSTRPRSCVGTAECRHGGGPVGHDRSDGRRKAQKGDSTSDAAWGWHGRHGRLLE